MVEPGSLTLRFLGRMDASLAYSGSDELPGKLPGQAPGYTVPRYISTARTEAPSEHWQSYSCRFRNALTAQWDRRSTLNNT